MSMIFHWPWVRNIFGHSPDDHQRIEKRLVYCNWCRDTAGVILMGYWDITIVTLW